MDPRRFIPSMFHRRLVLLVGIFLVVTTGLGAQMVRLAVLEGAQRRAEAEMRLDRRTYLPTYRGRILDRRGRILAEDRPSYDIAVSYEVLAGTWAHDRAAVQARREIGSGDWNSLGPEQRDQQIEKRLPQWKQRSEALWKAIEALGEIDEDALAERRNRILARLQFRSAVVWERQRAAWLRRFGTAEEHAAAAQPAQTPAPPQGEHSAGFRPRPLLEHLQPHVILEDVSDEVAFEFQRMSLELDGIVHVLPSHVRRRPWIGGGGVVRLDRGPESGLPAPLQSPEPLTIELEGVADHIIGSMKSEVSSEDIDRRPFVDLHTGEVDLGGYRIGDKAGSRGLEAAFEHLLRGMRGVINERKDTGEQDRIEPTPGSDLRTTLDIMLQSRVQAILSHELGLTRVQPWHNNDPSLPIGKRLNSSAVVLDVESGEILAMVSLPTMAMGEQLSEMRRSVENPWVNRPVEGIYPPGSIIKPLVLAAAVKEGVHSIHTPIECTGKFYDHIEQAARCWIYRERYGLATHGSLGASEAIARSCNIYFYTLADRLGMERMSKWFRRFGLGSPLDVGLRSDSGVGESAGDVPDEETIAAFRRDGDLNFATAILGIGQGPVTWTPVQAANAYAIIARGGIIRDATLVHDGARSEPRTSREHLALSPALVSAILEGLRQSVSEPHGTGYQIRYDDPNLAPDRIINAKNITVWAKTGTAQAPALHVDSTGDGELDTWLTNLSHAWFVGLVGPKNAQPAYAIAVLIEYGGSGGRAAGPVANQIIRALQHEHFLPNPPTPSETARLQRRSESAS